MTDGRDGRYRVPDAGQGAPRGRVVLVRHGEARCNVARVVGGHRGCDGLTPLGEAQALALARRLRRTTELAGATTLYSSVLARAVQTARLLAPALGGLAVQPDCALCELHPGECDGMPWADLAPLYGEPDLAADPDRPLSPGGESWRQFLTRVGTSLEGLAARHAGETVVIVSHGGVIDGSLVHFLAVPSLGSRMNLRTAHTSLTEWHHQAGEWRLVRYNDHAHLSGDPLPAVGAERPSVRATVDRMAPAELSPPDSARAQQA